MAVKINTIELLLEKIFSADIHTFSSSINQLFNYLKNEIKDNPVFDFYENQDNRDKIIKEWNEKNKSLTWGLFDDLEKTKLLIYNFYKIAGEQGNNTMNICFDLFDIAHNLDTSNISKFNESFSTYFKESVQDILNANKEFEDIIPNPYAKNSIFIIHGHDDNFKREVQLILKNAGVNNIVLYEQPDKGKL